MRKKKTKNNYLIIVILLLTIFSYYEINNNYRIGGIVRDFLFSPVIIDNYKSMTSLINKELEEENKELKKILDIDYSLTDFDLINASIIERDNTYWLNELTINKGIIHGIANDQIVISKDGMIGKVIDSSYNTSKIRLITGFNSPISVTINDISKLLTIDNYNLYIRGINQNDNIKIGDKVITSGLSDIFPKGILIGEIKEIRKETNDIGYYALVNLSANLNNLRFVSILKRKII